MTDESCTWWNGAESLTAASPRGPCLSDAEAREEIAARVGARFDPVVYAAFVRVDRDEWQALAGSID